MAGAEHVIIAQLNAVCEWFPTRGGFEEEVGPTLAR